MPELPEMEHYRRALAPLVVGKPISDALVEREKTINVSPDMFRSIVLSNAITTVNRRAKHLLFPLSNGYTLHLHLMLGGSMFYGTAEQKPDRSAQVSLGFAGGQWLYFHGLRLGYLHIHTQNELDQVLAKLGPDPFDPAITPEIFVRRLRMKRGTLKVALVDQSAVVSGIGNCYSDEICFAAGLLPTRKTSGLDEGEALRLYRSMQQVLRAATEAGGYMDVPLYDGDKATGGFDARCAVYDRGEEPCVRCGHPIVFAEVNSRKCFFCTQCQH